MWLDWVFANIFGIEEVLSAANANTYFDTINAALATDAFRPRALFERFNIEALATTEGPLDPLDHHRAIPDTAWVGRALTPSPPNPPPDPDFEGFAPKTGRAHV